MNCKCLMAMALVFCAAASMLGAGKSEQADTKPAAITFDTHDGYFVSNQFEPDKAQSFVVFKDQKTFEGIFKARRLINDKSHRLPEDIFDSKMVVATIKRGPAVWTYKVTDVVAADGVLTVRYTAASQKSDSATFSCPLIVSVPKGDYKAVVFEEGGKVAGKVDLSPAATQK